jgi:hypothetical protein
LHDGCHGRKEPSDHVRRLHRRLCGSRVCNSAQASRTGVTDCAPAAVCPGLLWAVTIGPRAPSGRESARILPLNRPASAWPCCHARGNPRAGEAPEALAKTDQLHWLALYRQAGCRTRTIDKVTPASPPCPRVTGHGISWHFVGRIRSSSPCGGRMICPQAILYQLVIVYRSAAGNNGMVFASRSVQKSDEFKEEGVTHHERDDRLGF